MSPSMSRIHLRPALLLSILLLPGWAHSADILTVYREAFFGDPELRAAAANRDAVKEGIAQSRALLLPDAEFRGTAEKSDFKHQPDQEITGFEIEVVQPIIRIARVNALRESEFNASAAQSDFTFAEQDLIIRVADAYFGLLRATNDLDFSRADREATRYQLNQATRRFEVGLVTITDVHEAQARFDLANADEITAEFNLEDAQEALRDLTGTLHRVVDRVRDDLPLDAVTPDDVEAWVVLAKEQNPGIDANRFSVESAREAIERQRAGHLPTLDAYATYFETNNNIVTRTGVDREGGSIGLRLSLDLYSGGAVNSRTREAQFRYQQSIELLEDTTRGVERQTRNAFQAVKAAISRVKALAQAVVSTRSGLEATQAGFEVGTRTIVDVLNSQRDALRAQRDYYQSRYVYIQGRLILEQAAGSLSVNDLEAVNAWLTPEKREINIGPSYDASVTL